MIRSVAYLVLSATVLLLIACVKHKLNISTLCSSMLFLDIDWIAKLDTLKDRMALNDSQVAAELGLSRSMLAQVRSGHRQLPTKVRLQLLDRLGYALTRGAVLAALGNELTETITEADNKRAQDRTSLLACFNFLEDEFERLGPAARRQFFDLVCVLASCDRKKLGALMGVRPAELREVEAAERRLHFLAKAALYENFDSVELAGVIDQVMPPADSPR